MSHLRFLFPLLLGLLLLPPALRSAAASEEKPAAGARPAQRAPKNAPQESSQAEPEDDLAALRRSADEFTAAFNSRNAKALAALWTENGDYTDETGRVFQGREAIAAEYARFFQNNGKVRLRLVVDSLKLLSDGAAIEDGRALLDPPPAGAPAISTYTVVHVKIDGKWLMSTVRDSRIETPSGYRHAADLEWLIGEWTAEEHGARIDSVCRWIANKSFVEHRHTVTHHDGTESSYVQIIGYDPQVGRIRSWSFSSDGGHAVGTWSPRPGGWQAEFQGTTADGLTTTAVNLLTRIDDNAYAWESVQRTAGGAPLADLPEVVLKRSPAK